MQGIIFDFNGTLFWDSHLHYDAWRLFSKKLRGYEFSDDEMRKYMFGRRNKDIIQYCIKKVPSDDMVKELAFEKEELYRQTCLKNPDCLKLANGATEFLNFLKEHNIPRTIATMSEWDNVKFYIENFNLENWFELEKIVYSNGKIKGKPHPEIYQIAAKNLNLNPKDCIVVEDAISGIVSAKSANIGKIIAIASLESHDYYKSISGVSQIIDNFEQIDKNMFKHSA